MTYKHIKVSDALTKQQAGQVDGPCFAIMDLRDKIKQSVRGLQFIDRTKKSLWVYREDCPFVLGWIGHGDFRQGRGGESMYVVHSRNIVNGKYGDFNVQYNMKMTANINTALKNVKTYIRAYTPAEMANVYVGTMSVEVRTVSDELNKKLRDIQGEVVDVRGYGNNSKTRLFTELKHLVTSGHKFVDPSFGEALVNYFRVADEVEGWGGRSVPMWFVRVYERLGSQAFDVVSVEDALRRRTPVGAEQYQYNAEGLPEDIMGKLSVLNLLTDEQYVDGVGYRVGEGMFYVAR